MNIDEAIEFATAAGFGADWVRYTLFAGVYAADPQLLEKGELPWHPQRDTLTDGEITPLRYWRDPRSVDLRFDQSPLAAEIIIRRWPCRIAFIDVPDDDLMEHFQEDRDISTSIVRPSGPLVRPLDWPLRIHVPENGRAFMMDRIWADTLIKPVDAMQKGSRPHFVFGTPEQLEAWAEMSPLWASMAVVFGPGNLSVPAGGVTLLPDTAPSDMGAFAALFVEELSHNQTVDVALNRAALYSNVVAPRVFADPAWLESNRLSRLIKAAGVRQQDLLNVGLSRRDRSRRDDSLSLEAAAPEVTMLDAYRDAEFHAESTDASFASRDFEQLQRKTEDRENRFLTAEVEPLAPEKKDFAARLSVWIAPLSDVGDATAPDAFPEEDLVWESAMLDLDIVLFELKDKGTALKQTISIARVGQSEKALFDIGWDGKWFEGRVIVLHKNRFVQSMLVYVSDGGKKVDIDRECLIRPLGPDLMDATPSDAAITLNDHNGPLMAVTTAAGQEIRTPTNLDESRKKMTGLLKEAIDDPDAFGSLTSPKYEDLLVNLAEMGSSLRDRLFTGSATAVAPDIYAELKAAKRISIFSAVPTHVLPLEFIYEPKYRPPMGQQGSICPRAAKALANPDASIDELRKGCSKFGGSACETSDAIVCPLGFWGLSKVIERHANRKERIDIARDYAISASPSDARGTVDVSRLLAAATSKADANPEKAWTAARKTLSDAFGEDMIVHKTWPAIQSELITDEGPPGLMVLLPHVEKDRRGVTSLDLGEGPSLAVHQVSAQLEDLNPKPPLVLLLGCATGAGENPTEEFPGGFLDAGAAAVLATMTLVRGRFVAEIAETASLLTRDLIAKEGRTTLGETVLHLRQRLLASNPFVLTLTAYGDADWLLVVPEDETD